jgi:hypothetical protein
MLKCNCNIEKSKRKGLMTVEDAKPMVEGIIKKTKKRKIITKCQVLPAKSTANKTTQNANDATVDNPVLPNVGMEGKVVGTAWNCC